MPQSLSQVWLHIVFSTKNRQAFLQNGDFRQELFHMLSHPLKEIDCSPQSAGGGIDHVHLVCGLSPTLTVDKLVEHLKIETAKWARKASSGGNPLTWQSGYGAFSISPSNLDRVIEYVDRQEEYHQRQSYQDEFRMLCQKHGIEIDERSAWD